MKVRYKRVGRARVVRYIAALPVALDAACGGLASRSGSDCTVDMCAPLTPIGAFDAATSPEPFDGGGTSDVDVLDSLAPLVDASTSNDATARRDAEAPDDGGTSGALDSGATLDESGVTCAFGSVGASCSPQPLGSCSPSYVPVVQGKGSCVPGDVPVYYERCLGYCNGMALSASSPECQDCQSLLSSAACFTCLTGFANVSPWGLAVNYVGTSGFWLNQAGCYAALGATAACVAATEELAQCEIAACRATCEGNDASVAQGEACIAVADDGECESYVTALNASCPGAIRNDPGCMDSDDAGVYAVFAAMAQTMCE